MRRLAGRSGVALCLLAAACGGGSDSGPSDDAPVRASVRALYAAAAEQDGEAMCRRLAPAWRTRLDRGPPPCRVEALSVVLGPGPPRNLRIERVELDGRRATARAVAVRGHGAAERDYGHELDLVARAGVWRVARVRELGP
jgi:hypothetical protein